MQLHLFEHLQSPGHNSFIEDICITLTNTVDSFVLTNGEITGKKTFKTLARHAINMKENLYYLTLYFCAFV